MFILLIFYRDKDNFVTGKNIEFEPYSESSLAQFVKYVASNNTCQFPKKLQLYIFYYPILEDGIVQYKISKGYYMFKQQEVELSTTSKNFLEIAVKYVDLTAQDSVNEIKRKGTFFPTTLGSIFQPIFE